MQTKLDILAVTGAALLILAGYWLAGRWLAAAVGGALLLTAAILAQRRRTGRT